MTSSRRSGRTTSTVGLGHKSTGWSTIHRRRMHGPTRTTVLARTLSPNRWSELPKNLPGNSGQSWSISQQTCTAGSSAGVSARVVRSVHPRALHPRRLSIFMRNSAAVCHRLFRCGRLFPRRLAIPGEPRDRSISSKGHAARAPKVFITDRSLI